MKPRWEVEKVLQDVKKRLFQTFWDHILDEITRRLKDNGQDQRWEVWCEDNIFISWASPRNSTASANGWALMRVHRKTPRTILRMELYAVRAEDLNFNNWTHRT